MSTDTKHTPGRFEAVKSGNNGAWAIYDKERKVTIMRSVSPIAKYNREVAKMLAAVPDLVNTLELAAQQLRNTGAGKGEWMYELLVKVEAALSKANP